MNNKEKLYLIKAANKLKRPNDDIRSSSANWGGGLSYLLRQRNSQPKKNMLGTGEGLKPRPTLPNKPLRDSRYQLPAYSQQK